MMPNYLGSNPINQKDTPYANYGPSEWAKYYLVRYGGIDGDHHKTWVMDQAIRILMGTPVKIQLAKWDNGEQEYRIDTGKASKEYQKYCKNAAEEGYEVDPGIAP
jgi:hypothetical protein